MRLRITHRTEYQYDAPVPYALQRIRLVPLTGDLQTVLSWSLAIDGAREELRFVDHFGNDTRLLSVTGGPHLIAVEVAGEVDTTDRAGVCGPHRGFTPLWLFQAETGLTAAGDGIKAIAGGVSEAADIERLHALMAAIGERVEYRPGATTTLTTAEDAVASGAGVCQDHSHIFIAAARHLGFPARYVSGYLRMDKGGAQAATHAWAEAHVAGLGWVGFDVANGISPDERYVRVATGRDYRDAMPVSGIRLGQGDERLEVKITVEQ
jgi:transglutaminase-like putative cysteine protease